MRSLTIKIEGKFWDSLIYSGKLYLFYRDGSISTVNWDSLVNSIHTDSRDSKWFRSILLSGTEAYLLKKYFDETEIQDLVQEKMKRLSQKEFIIDNEFLEKHLIRKQDNKLPFPHSDAQIYNNKIYAGTQQKLSATSCGKKFSGHGISTRIEDLWDGPTYSLSAYWKHIGIASGSEGLFDLDVEQNSSPQQLKKRRFHKS